MGFIQNSHGFSQVGLSDSRNAIGTSFCCRKRKEKEDSGPKLQVDFR
jgi:hypothetical protein